MNGKNLIGLFGVIVFWVVLYIAGSVYPNYSHIEMPISMLGNTASANGWIINYSGLVVLGLSIFFTGIFAFSKLSGTGNKLGTLLIVIGGIGTAFVGLFNCHSTLCDPAESTDNLLHVIGTMLTFLMIPLAALIIGMKGMLSRKNNRIVFFLMFICGIGAFVFLLMLNGVIPNDLLAFGLNQRLIVFFVTAFIALLSVHLQKLESQAVSTRLAE